METACTHSELDYRIKQWEKKLRDLSLEIVKSGNKKIPCLLLQVKSYLDDDQLNSKEYTTIKKLLWKYKFFQAILVFLKRDYRVDGGWTTAAKLSKLLSQICTGIDFADSVEFKDDCLPAADRNMLILAVRIHDDLMESSVNQRDVLINDFRTVLNALIYLTSGYNFLVKPVIMDENLLKLLMTDDVVIGTEIINLIRTILRLNWDTLQQLDSKLIHTFLDEIIYKLSVYTDPKIQIASCNCILEFCEHYPALVDVLCTKYKGLRIILMKQAEKIHCRELKPLLVLLNAGSSEHLKKQKYYLAVEKIQSAWRGYITRKKLKKANEAISKLQKCFLSRKQTREKEQEDLRELSEKNEQMQSFQLLKMRSFREKQLQKMELTPAYQILKYQAVEMENAAICIQKNWRGYRIRCQLNKFHTNCIQHRAAVKIQRAVRKWLKRTISKVLPIPTKLKPQTLTEERRMILQQQINDWRETQSKKLGSFEEQKRLHQKASELLQQFYSSLQASRKQLLYNNALLARLDVDSDSLINAPNIESVTEKDVDIYSSPSLPISTKAKIAHKKALKKIVAPWWQKLEGSDEEDITLNDNFTN